MKRQLALLLTAIAAFSCSGPVVTPRTSQESAGTITTIAGLGPTQTGNSGDGGLATAAKVSWVTSVAVDQAGNVYFTDGAANNVRKINANTGIISTLAGHPYPTPITTFYAGDGGPATDALLNIPLGIAFSSPNQLYIADAGNSVIRAVDTTTHIISTFAGTARNSTTTYSGDGDLANKATFWNPEGIAVDAQGNVYVADKQDHVIRKIDKATSIIHTIAGLGPDQAGFSGDGGAATSAKLNAPQGIAIDADGTIYFSDYGNYRIRKISNGIISTIAGTGNTGYSGDGGPALAATFNSVTGLAIDSYHNLFLVDGVVIRKISSGIITTVAGNGKYGYSGDGGDALSASLASPWGIAVDASGNLYIADSGNSAIRKVTTK